MTMDSGSAGASTARLSLPAGSAVTRRQAPAVGSRHVGARRLRVPAPASGAVHAIEVHRYHLHGDILPANELLRDLYREKRRAERTGAPLSMVLYQVGDRASQAVHFADDLLEVLHGAKRETDYLGHLDDGTIAVLCPDTDQHGIACFMRKVETLAGRAAFAATAATYPDDVFERLSASQRPDSPVQELLAESLPVAEGQTYGLKRALDVVGAIAAIGILAPVMLFVAAAVALTSKGPVIFKQTRLGKGGVPFAFYKFRSMVTNSDDAVHRQFVADLIKSEQRGNVSGGAAPYKLQADSRVTRIGRIIRKTSLDELPQLFNVLKGDMSLVGPRPPIPYETANYQPWHLRRILAIQPGITGLWQVEGRSRVTFNEMVRMDLRYIRDCSLAMDVAILMKTVRVVLRCDGAR